MKIEQTEYETLWTNYDLTGFDLIGSYVYTDGMGAVGPIEAVYWDPSLSAALTSDNLLGTPYDVLSGLSTGPYYGRLFIKGSLPQADEYEALSSAVLYQYGAGQSEKSECSDRGVCETDSGLCKCFSGYTGNACETQ